ncbi:T9SS type A sorting domain-containing protein [Flavobacterium channae]|uniref:T9SS type A sorting domain-containing protein n=1 Tax=Flavobacterium channae TaxID=2897181 RepID=UPI001E6308A5|nr:T9SS type A sorting domain-containing protein [Flavobacterium channae]UGS23425.1 T9SS type A sorting domain-containing protein [Flavobacterium channae]
MKKLYTLLFVALTGVAFGQASITALNTPYTENFDGMTPTGTTFPTNWSAIRAAGSGTANQTLTMAITDGTANSGTVYNVGTTGNSDRAFGSIASGSTVPAFGMSFTNNTGDQITEFNIALKIEQWRTGSLDTANEVMLFSYSTNATNLSDGTWINATNLNINEILTSTTASAAVDGNATGNNANLNGTVNISSTPWANGSTLWIKWLDDNAAGNDSLLAIDDFSFSATSNVLSSSSFNSIDGLTMYPNPLKGDTLFLTSTANADMSVQIYDVLGKEVVNSKVMNNTVNVSGLNAGVYIVKVTEEGKTATRKLVIQ